MDNLRGLLGIRRMERVPNPRIRELCGATKGLDERNDENVLRWFGQVERMENDRIVRRVYVGECAGSRSISSPRKKWIDTMKDCLMFLFYCSSYSWHNACRPPGGERR